MKLVHYALAVAFLTASFDIFLVINVGGGSLRLCQILLVAVILAACAFAVQRQAILWPRGGYALALWCFLQLVLITRSVVPALSLQLYILLLLPVLGALAILQLYGRSAWVSRLMLAYIGSFVVIAAFGLFQLVAPILHLGAPFITQWVRHGLLPRVNGFSYEPSFYATYMIMGWITLVDLRVSKAALFAGRRWLWLTWLVSLGLFFSTSKTAWVLMLIEGFTRLLPPIRRLVKLHFHRLLRGDLRLRMPRPRTFVVVFAALLSIGIFLTVVDRYLDLNTFLQGSGVNNTASHSLDERTRQFEATLTVIHEHFWIGSSLGGVAGRIAEIKGEPLRSIADLKTMWGFPVPVDIFAASGMLGVLPFLWYFLQITIGEKRLMKANPEDDRAKWLHALIRGLIFEWVFFCFDQNIVRMYFWFHISVLTVVAYNLRYVPAPAQPKESLVSV